MSMREEYKKVVNDVITNPNIKDIVYNLLHECMIDEERRKAEYYMTHGKYPENRDILHKLMYDLELVSLDRKNKLKKAEMVGGKNV